MTPKLVLVQHIRVCLTAWLLHFNVSYAYQDRSWRQSVHIVTSQLLTSWLLQNNDVNSAKQRNCSNRMHRTIPISHQRFFRDLGYLYRAHGLHPSPPSKSCLGMFVDLHLLVVLSYHNAINTLASCSMLDSYVVLCMPSACRSVTVIDPGSNLFPTSSKALKTAHREPMLHAEILSHSADIMCMQASQLLKTVQLRILSTTIHRKWIA